MKEKYQNYISKLDSDITLKRHIFYIIAFALSCLAVLCFLLPQQVFDTATDVNRGGAFSWTIMKEIGDNYGFNFLPYGGYFLFFVVTIFLLYLMVKSLKDRKREDPPVGYPISTLYIFVLGVVGIGFLSTLGSIYTETMNNGTYSLGVFSLTAIIAMAIAVILVITPYSIKVCTYIGRSKPEAVEEKPSLKSRCSSFIGDHYKVLVSAIILIIIASTLTIFGYQGRIYSNGGLGNVYYEVMYIGPAIYAVCALAGMGFLISATTFNDKVGANTRLMRYIGFYILVVFGIAVGLVMTPLIIENHYAGYVGSSVSSSGSAGPYVNYVMEWAPSMFVSMGLAVVACLLSIPLVISQYKAYKGVYGTTNDSVAINVQPDELEDAVIAYQKQEYSLSTSTNKDQVKILNRTVHKRQTLYNMFLIVSIFFAFMFVVMLIAYFSGMNQSYVLILTIVFGALFLCFILAYLIVQYASSTKEEIVLISDSEAAHLTLLDKLKEEEKEESKDGEQSGESTAEIVEVTAEVDTTQVVETETAESAETKDESVEAEAETQEEKTSETDEISSADKVDESTRTED